MMWFVVISRNGREEPSKYHDWLPDWIRGKHAKEWGVVNVTRLDTLAQPEFWMGLRPIELYTCWQHGRIGNPEVVAAYQAKVVNGGTSQVNAGVVSDWPVAPGFEGL